MKTITLDTASGARYMLNPNTMTVCRYNSGHEGATELRRDGEEIKLLEWPDIDLDKPLVMLLQVRSDDVVTVRSTTPVIQIKEPE